MQYHGPNRDNRSTETGLLDQWPEGGPELLWQVEGLGEGYGTVAVASGMIYVAGDTDDACMITAMDLDGRVLWREPNGGPYARSFPGARSTPTIADGKLYHINGLGEMVCLNAETGEPVWRVNYYERFDGVEVQWGVAESPLVDGQHVICCPGGEDVFTLTDELSYLRISELHYHPPAPTPQEVAAGFTNRDDFEFI